MQQKTTLHLDPETHKRLRFLALERNSTLTALVEQALQEFLARAERRKK